MNIFLKGGRKLKDVTNLLEKYNDLIQMVNVDKYFDLMKRASSSIEVILICFSFSLLFKNVNNFIHFRILKRDVKIMRTRYVRKIYKKKLEWKMMKWNKNVEQTMLLIISIISIHMHVISGKKLFV